MSRGAGAPVFIGDATGEELRAADAKDARMTNTASEAAL